MEHILSVNALLQDARVHANDLEITFIDLRNAFGSISHQLLLDMLVHVKVPMQVSRGLAAGRKREFVTEYKAGRFYPV